MSNPPVIQVDQLTKYYGKTVGIESLSLEVNRGEIFGFLGPNGAGKTTTIRLILDLLRPTGGEISMFGQSLVGHSLDARKRSGYLPGNFSAYGHLTGAQFLQLAAKLRGTPTALPQEMLERFDLSKKDLSQKVRHLSHGNAQKIGIIQAFFHEPELLILDEPTTGLDPLMQEAFYDLVKQAQKRGATIFFSSHNLPEVEKVCERVAIIREGKLVALETLDGLRKKRYRRLKLTLSKPVNGVHLPNAEIVLQQDLQYEFLIKGDIQGVLKELAHLPVEDLVFPEPDLEEVFVAYYRREND